MACTSTTPVSAALALLLLLVVALRACEQRSHGCYPAAGRCVMFPPCLCVCVHPVIVASGANDKADPLGPFNVDYSGNLNLIAAAKAAGVKHFVLVTSIGTDDILNPLNLFWGVSRLVG